MKTKKTGSIFIWIFAAFALFLAIPFITTEEGSSSKKGNLSIEEDGVLPVVGSENPLAKYFNKVADFYGFKKKAPAGGRNSFAANASSAANDEELFGAELSGLFAASKDASSSAEAANGGASAEDLEAIRAAYAKAAAVSVEDGTVKTRSGMVLKPSKEGYEFDGKFYKNGNYPSLSKRREIENALSKFHKENAARQGLTAAYFRAPDGSLNVKYVSPESLPGRQTPLLASDLAGTGGNYYRGARIISKGESSGGGSYSSSRGGHAGKFSMDNIEDAYDSLSSKIKENLSSSDSSGSDENPSEDSGPEQNLSKELIANSSNASISFLAPSKRTEIPNEIPMEYQNAPGAVLAFTRTPIGSHSMAEFLNKYGIKGNLNLKEIELNLSRGRSERNLAEVQSADEKIQSLKNDEGLVKVFSPAPLPESLFKKNPVDNGIYVAYPRVPWMEVGENGQPKEVNFSEVFFSRTGIGNMVEAMGNPETGEFLDATDLENRYAKLDAKRSENNKYIQMIGSNATINKRMPKMVFYLGKARKNQNNIMIASPSSFLYVYAPNMAPDFVAGASAENSYQEMPSEEFLNKVGTKGNNNIVVVNDEKVRETLIKAGVKNVSVIEEERLSSGVPEDIEYVIDSLKTVVSERVMSDDVLKQEFIKAMSQTNKKVSGE